MVLGFLAAVIGCGGGDNDDIAPVAQPGSGAGQVTPAASADADAAPAGGAKEWDPALGTATIKGVVKFDGKPPRRRPIDFGAKKECSALHTMDLLDESAIVNADGRLKNVFIYVKKGLGGFTFPAASEPVVLNQVGCNFTPHVVGARVNQDILIRNSDPVTHNVHAVPTLNSGFNFSQTTKGKEDVKKFGREEFMFKIVCDVHTWMGTYVSVVNHPYFVVSGDDGVFELPNLPPGEYDIEARHELFGRQQLTIKVADKGTQEIEFTFKEK